MKSRWPRPINSFITSIKARYRRGLPPSNQIKLLENLRYKITAKATFLCRHLGNRQSLNMLKELKLILPKISTHSFKKTKRISIETKIKYNLSTCFPTQRRRSVVEYDLRFLQVTDFLFKTTQSVFPSRISQSSKAAHEICKPTKTYTKEKTPVKQAKGGDRSE